MKIKDLILHKRFIASVVVVTFGVSCITAYAGYKFINTALSPDVAEERTIRELSEKTGATEKEIEDLRLQGRSFGEIGEMLNKNMESVISNEQLEELISAFSEDEISQAEALSDRVSFALREIHQRKETIGIDPNETQEEGLEEYFALYEKYEPNKAIYLTLKFKNEENDYQSIMDEYLLCLQIDVDMMQKIDDYEAYEEAYQKNIVKVTAGQEITVSKLEAKMLEVIQKQRNILPSAVPEKPGETVAVPDRIKPANPLEEIEKEIEKFQNPSVSGNGGKTDEK